MDDPTQHSQNSSGAIGLNNFRFMKILHTLTQISDHVYWFSPDDKTDRPVLGAIVGQTNTLWVDVGNSVASGLYIYRFSVQSVEKKSNTYNKSGKMLLLR